MELKIRKRPMHYYDPYFSKKVGKADPMLIPPSANEHLLREFNFVVGGTPEFSVDSIENINSEQYLIAIEGFIRRQKWSKTMHPLLVNAIMCFLIHDTWNPKTTSPAISILEFETLRTHTSPCTAFGSYVISRGEIRTWNVAIAPRTTEAPEYTSANLDNYHDQWKNTREEPDPCAGYFNVSFGFVDSTKIKHSLALENSGNHSWKVAFWQYYGYQWCTAYGVIISDQYGGKADLDEKYKKMRLDSKECTYQITMDMVQGKITIGKNDLKPEVVISDINLNVKYVFAMNIEDGVNKEYGETAWIKLY